jgi:hypothetical protein
MALDATVYCNCFELSRLISPPPAGCHLSVGEDGVLLCGNDDLDVMLAFDRWQQSEACEHESGYLVSHWIGNIALVAAYRSELERWAQRFPIILSRVIYDGVHCGDFIRAAEVPQLVPEVEALAGVRCAAPEMERYIRAFRKQMQELVVAALQVGKPIVF